ncbi:MAG: hypothetical protein WCQ99_06285 [Pseudomonadota bacterium]
MFFNPAGGVLYHFRAALYARSRWQPFRRAVGEWLHRWDPPEKKLILIGASGGYALDSAFLGRFDKIIAVDPDPVSKWIFQKRFPSVTTLLRWITTDFFITAEHSAERLHAFLSHHPDAAILISNFLGQLPFLIHDLNTREKLILFWQNTLYTLLHGRSWASFHDRYSSSKAPNAPRHFCTAHQCTGEELVRRFYGRDCSGEWRDHSTELFFSAQSLYDYFLWQLTPKSFHIIEGVYATSAR